MKTLKYFIYLLFLLTSFFSFAQDYESKLNAVLDKAKTFKEFAESKELRDQYYEVLKKDYLNSHHIGKSEFDNIIDQNLKLVKQDPSLDKLFWTPKNVPDIDINLSSNISVQGLNLESRDSWVRHLNDLKESKKPVTNFKTDAEAKDALMKASELIRQKKQSLAAMEGTKKAKELANIEFFKEIKTGDAFKEYREAIEFFTYDYYFLDNFDKLKNSNSDIIYHVLGQAELGKIFNSNPEFNPDDIAKIDVTSYKAANNFELTRKQVSEIQLTENQFLFKKLEHVDGGKTKAGAVLKYRLEGIKRPINSMFSGRFHGECITGTSYSCALRRTNIGTYTDSQHYHLLNEKGEYVGYLNKGTITHKPTKDKYYTLDVVGEAWGKNMYTQDEKTGLLVEKNIFETWFDQEYKTFEKTQTPLQKGYVITDGSNYSNTTSYKQIITTDLYKKSKSSDPLKAKGSDFTHFHDEGSLDAKMNNAITSIFGKSTNYNVDGNPVMGSLSEGNQNVHQVLLKPQEGKTGSVLNKAERYFYSTPKFKGLIDKDRTKAMELIDHFYGTDVLKSNKDIQKTVLESLGYFLTKIEDAKELEALSTRFDKEKYLSDIYGQGNSATKTAEADAYSKQFRKIVKTSSLEDKRLLVNLFADRSNDYKASLLLDLLDSDFKSDKELMEFLSSNNENFRIILGQAQDPKMQKSVLEKLARLAESKEYGGAFSDFIQEQIANGRLEENRVTTLFKSLDENLKNPAIKTKYKILRQGMSSEGLEEIFKGYQKNKAALTSREWIDVIKRAPKRAQYDLLNKYLAADYPEGASYSPEARTSIQEVLRKTYETDRTELITNYINTREAYAGSSVQTKPRLFIEQITTISENPFDAYLASVKDNIKLYSNQSYEVFTAEQKIFLKNQLASKVNRDKFVKFLEELNTSTDEGVKSFLKASYQDYASLWPKAELANFEILTSRANPELLLKVLESPEDYKLTRTIKNNLFKDYFVNFQKLEPDQTLKIVKSMRESKEFSYLIARNSGLTGVELANLNTPYGLLGWNYEAALKTKPGLVRDIELQELGTITAKGNYKKTPSSFNKSVVFAKKENLQFSLLNYIEGSIPDGERSFLNMATTRELLLEAHSQKIKFTKLSAAQQARMDKIIQHLTRISDPDQMADARQTLEKLFALMDPDEARRAFSKFENDTFFVRMITNNNELSFADEKRWFTNNANSSLDELTSRFLNPRSDKLQLLSKDEAKLIAGSQYDDVWKKYFSQKGLEYEHIIKHQNKFNTFYSQLPAAEQKAFITNISTTKVIKEPQYKAIRQAIISNKNTAFLDVVTAVSGMKNNNLITNAKVFKGEWENIFNKMDKDQILEFLKQIRTVNGRENSTLRNVVAADPDFFNLLLKRAGTLQIPYTELKDYSAILKETYLSNKESGQFMHAAFDAYADALKGNTKPDKFLQETYDQISKLDDHDTIASHLNYLLKNADEKTKLEYMEKFLNDPKLAKYTKNQLLTSFVKHLPSEDILPVYDRFMEKNAMNPNYKFFENLDVTNLTSKERSSLLLMDVIESNKLLSTKEGLSDGLEAYRINSLNAEKKLGILSKKMREGIYDKNTKISQKEVNLLMEKYENLSSSNLDTTMRTLFSSSTHKETNEALLRNELRNTIKTLPATGDDLTTAKRISKYYPDNVLFDELKNMLQSGNLDKDLIRNYLRVLNSKVGSEGESFGRTFVNEILTPLFSGDFKNMKPEDYAVFLKELRGIKPDAKLIPIKRYTLSKFLSYNKNDSTDWLKFLKENKSQEVSAEFFGLLDDLDVPAFSPGNRSQVADALSVYFGDLKSSCARQSPCFKYWEKSLNSFHSYHGGKKKAYETLSFEDDLIPTKAKIAFNTSIGSRILQCFKLGAKVLNKNTMEHIWDAVNLGTSSTRIPPRFMSGKKALAPLSHIKI